MEWVEDEAVVLNEATKELHYLNPQSALIYALLLEYGLPAAVTHACERIDGPAREIEEEVRKLAQSFLEKGLLTEAAD